MLVLVLVRVPAQAGAVAVVMVVVLLRIWAGASFTTELGFAQGLLWGGRCLDICLDILRRI